jgi:cell division septal protein FtsQ
MAHITKTAQDITNTISENDRAKIADLNDWALRTLRDIATENGWNHEDELLQLVSEELKRIQPDDQDDLVVSLKDYLRISRAGSTFALSRRQRLPVYAYIATAAKTRNFRWQACV